MVIGESSGSDGHAAANSALHSLLVAVREVAGAKEVCIVTPRGDTERISLASSRSSAPAPNRLYEEGVHDISTDVRYEGQVLGNLVVIDHAGPVDHAQLDAFASVAGYIMGNSRSLKELITVPANEAAQAIHMSALTGEEMHEVTDFALPQQQDKNVAEKARAQADELRAQQAFLNRILDNFPGLLFAVELPDFRLVMANSKVNALSPEPYRSGASLVGKTFSETSSAGNTAELEAILTRVTESGEPISFEQYEAAGTGGAPTYWNWVVTPVDTPAADGRKVALVAAYEVTEIVQARENVQQSAEIAWSRAEELEAVINQMADGVAIFDSSGQITKLNPEGSRLLGRGIVDPSGATDYANLYGLHTLAGDPVEYEQLPSTHALRGETLVGMQLLVKKPAGADAIISISAAPLTDRKGVVNGAVVVFHDITQEKMIERLKDEFLSVVSHELRTPLSAIMGYSDLMLRGVHGALNDRQARALNAVRSNAKRLLHLINDLLDVSRFESGVVPLNMEALSVADIISRTITHTKVLAVNAGVLVRNEVSRQLPRVTADEQKVQQIIENLLSNALKFTPRGGTITFRGGLSSFAAGETAMLEGSESSVDSGGAPQSVIISVADTGSGLAADQLTRVWDRFYQVDATAKRRSGGAGLGLAIVRSLVELHGGQVWVRSEGQNKGSEFSFSLPVDTAYVEDGATSASPVKPMDVQATSEQGPADVTLLVAEDDIDQREIICDMLEMEGYKVVTANNGTEALQIASRLHPAAIILDVILPLADGWDVLNELRKDPYTADIPVLVVSVVDQAEFGRRLGANDYLLKPLNPWKLRESVRKMLGSSDPTATTAGETV